MTKRDDKSLIPHAGAFEIVETSFSTYVLWYKRKIRAPRQHQKKTVAPLIVTDRDNDAPEITMRPDNDAPEITMCPR